MTRRKWFLLEHPSGGTDFSRRHHVSDLKAGWAACGRQVPVKSGLFTQHFPKKQPPKCRACVRAVARRR